MVSSRCQGIKCPGSRPFKGRWEAKDEIPGGLSATRKLSRTGLWDTNVGDVPGDFLNAQSNPQQTVAGTTSAYFGGTHGLVGCRKKLTRGMIKVEVGVPSEPGQPLFS